MAPAVTNIVRHTGAPSGGGGTTRDIIDGASTMAMTDDAHHPSGSVVDPLIVPSSGIIFSYWVSVRWNAVTSPVGAINNLRFYTDGTRDLLEGIDLLGGLAFNAPNAGYRQATGRVGSSGDQLLVVTHTGLGADPEDLFQYLSGTPLAMSGSLSNPNTGDFGDFLVFQMSVSSLYTGGTQETVGETFTMQYDET